MQSQNLQKARPFPFALEETVTEELDRLEKAGILKSIPFLEWTSPIVCGDFKRSVNPNIETQIYPTPINDEIFSKTKGGQRFSKIDLRHAYLQLELDKNPRKLMVINTHKGLSNNIKQCLMVLSQQVPFSNIAWQMP